MPQRQRAAPKGPPAVVCAVSLAREEIVQARCEEDHHAEDDEHSDDAPQGLYYLLGALMKKKTHAVQYMS